MRSRLLPLTLVLLAAAPALAQDGDAEPEPPAVQPPAPAEEAQEAAPEPITFGDSLDEARATAKEQGKPLLVVSVPDWYASPAWKQVEDDVLADADAAQPLAGFVRVVVKETRDREVHVRHRVPFEGYPLAVVLSSDGSYLGHTSGLPAMGVDTWATRIAAIPARAERIAALREKLDAAPEDPGVLYELGLALVEAGESDRADALFERMEQADPLAPADRLGEARYHRLRHRIIDLMEARKFPDVEGLCLRWRRRFAEHARAPDVLLLQANAHFLAGEAPDARALWEQIAKDHADSDAAKSAKKALAELKD
jgi:tetratricopeptide (TPR) repeat protein